MKNIDIKNQKAITLVALVITIIILLILAGISIASLTGSGLFERAKEAKNKSQEAQNKENGILDEYEKNIEKYINGYDEFKEMMSYANLENKYSSISELFENTTDLNTIMNNKQCVNIMVGSEEIMNSIAKNSNAMNSLMDSKYASYAVIKNTKSKNIILNSEYSEEFNNKNLVSPTLNGYVNNLTYSSCNSDQWAAWKVFDRNENTQWGTVSNITLPNWIQYNFEKEYLIYKVVIVNAYQSGMGEQSGNIYINDINAGSYDVKTEKEPYNIECQAQGNTIKVTCDKYNWQGAQSYLSEIYVYGVEVETE